LESDVNSLFVVLCIAMAVSQTVFSLFGETPQIDKSFEEFCLRLRSQSSQKQIESPSTEDCALCGSEKLNVFQILRSCKCTQYPCEHHECKCGGQIGIDKNYPKIYPACASCIITCLWKSTSENLKSNGRYRAKCPFCKAEFCHLDLVFIKQDAISPSPEETPQKSTNSNSNSNSNANAKPNSKIVITKKRNTNLLRMDEVCSTLS